MPNTLHPLTARLDQNLLPQDHTPLTVALSGGADSVALLLLLRELQPQFGYALQAIHVHHHLRGTDANRDADFCMALCAAHSIPFQQLDVDVSAYASQQRISIETAARTLRYRALETAAPTGTIATAHHAGDQAETILFHLLRGSGLRGLCGIPAQRGRIIRPLLRISKEELLTYLADCGQDYVTDCSNHDLRYTRNWLRHQVIPLLKACNPNSIAHMARTASLLAEDEAYLTKQAAMAETACHVASSMGEAALRGLEDYPRPIRMRVYRQWITAYTDPSFEKLRALDALLLAGNGTICISGDCYATMQQGMLTLTKRTRSHHTYANLPCADFAVALPQKLEHPFFCECFPNKTCRVELLKLDCISHKIHNPFTKSTLDYDKIVGRARFQQWRGADRITLPARPFSSSLKTCIQAAVPAGERRRLYVLYDDLGCIYCEGVGIAARVKPDAKTTRCLRLTPSRASQIQKE